MFDSAGRQDVRNIKPINFRPILFSALSLFVGVILYRNYPVMGAWTILTPIFAMSLICLVCYITFGKEKRHTVLATSAVCFIFILIGMLSLGLKVNSATNKAVASGYYTVVGEVKDVSYKDGGYYATLTDCTYNGEEGGDFYTYRLQTKVDLYDIVEIKCYVKSDKVVNGDKISHRIISEWSNYASRIDNVRVVGKSNSIASRFKTRTDAIFKKILGEDFGILSALLRGDDSEMSQTVELFRLVGIAHIFAVSGLHIGLIFTALSFIFGKLKINRIIKTVIISLTLIFYSYLCGFSPSSLRATIMCTCMMISKLLGQKHDGINALSIAAIIVVLINATDLFSVGFILSFTICFSILVLAPPIKSVLSFMPNEFSSSLSVLFASQAGILPLSIKYFGGFPLVSFFANFLLLPIVSILYYLTVIGVVICLILPINEHIALFIPQILTVGIKGVTEFMANFPLVLDYMSIPLAIAYYALLLCVSDFINLPKKAKFSCGVFILVLVLFVAARSFFGVPA